MYEYSEGDDWGPVMDADEARAIFERLRARPYLERLAAALGEAAVTA